MTVLLITKASLDNARHALRPMLAMPLGHRTEVIARALGFQTHASLLSAFLPDVIEHPTGLTQPNLQEAARSMGYDLEPGSLQAAVIAGNQIFRSASHLYRAIGWISVNRTQMLLEAVSLTFLPDWKASALRSDGRTVYYNPRQIYSLHPNDVANIVVEACMHRALGHHSLRGDRDPLLWSIACGHIAAQSLAESPFGSPRDATYHPAPAGLHGDIRPESAYNLVYASPQHHYDKFAIIIEDGPLLATGQPASDYLCRDARIPTRLRSPLRPHVPNVKAILTGDVPNGAGITPLDELFLASALAEETRIGARDRLSGDLRPDTPEWLDRRARFIAYVRTQFSRPIALYAVMSAIEHIGLDAPELLSFYRALGLFDE